jgi:hypothetical protein
MKRKLKVRDTRITPEILTMYRLAHQLHDCANIETWEEEGGHRRKFLDACVKLHAMLGRRPWQEDVIDTLDFEPPDDRQERKDWNVACALLKQLEQAAASTASTRSV